MMRCFIILSLLAGAVICTSNYESNIGNGGENGNVEEDFLIVVRDGLGRDWNVRGPTGQESDSDYESYLRSVTGSNYKTGKTIAPLYGSNIVYGPGPISSSPLGYESSYPMENPSVPEYRRRPGLQLGSGSSTGIDSLYGQDSRFWSALGYGPGFYGSNLGYGSGSRLVQNSGGLVGGSGSRGGLNSESKTSPQPGNVLRSGSDVRSESGSGSNSASGLQKSSTRSLTSSIISGYGSENNSGSVSGSHSGSDLVSSSILKSESTSVSKSNSTSNSASRSGSISSSGKSSPLNGSLASGTTVGTISQSTTQSGSVSGGSSASSDTPGSNVGSNGSSTSIISGSGSQNSSGSVSTSGLASTSGSASNSGSVSTSDSVITSESDSTSGSVSTSGLVSALGSASASGSASTAGSAITSGSVSTAGSGSTLGSASTTGSVSSSLSGTSSGSSSTSGSVSSSQSGTSSGSSSTSGSGSKCDSGTSNSSSASSFTVSSSTSNISQTTSKAKSKSSSVSRDSYIKAWISGFKVGFKFGYETGFKFGMESGSESGSKLSTGIGSGSGSAVCQAEPVKGVDSGAVSGAWAGSGSRVETGSGAVSKTVSITASKTEAGTAGISNTGSVVGNSEANSQVVNAKDYPIEKGQPIVDVGSAVGPGYGSNTGSMPISEAKSTSNSITTVVYETMVGQGNPRGIDRGEIFNTAPVISTGKSRNVVSNEAGSGISNIASNTPKENWNNEGYNFGGGNDNNNPGYVIANEKGSETGFIRNIPMPPLSPVKSDSGSWGGNGYGQVKGVSSGEGIVLGGGGDGIGSNPVAQFESGPERKIDSVRGVDVVPGLAGNVNPGAGLINRGNILSNEAVNSLVPANSNGIGGRFENGGNYGTSTGNVANRESEFGYLPGNVGGSVVNKGVGTNLEPNSGPRFQNMGGNTGFPYSIVNSNGNGFGNGGEYGQGALNNGGLQSGIGPVTDIGSRTAGPGLASGTGPRIGESNQQNPASEFGGNYGGSGFGNNQNNQGWKNGLGSPNFSGVRQGSDQFGQSGTGFGSMGNTERGFNGGNFGGNVPLNKPDERMNNFGQRFK